MEFLLKIVEGAARGAEIALVGGMRLKLGRGADCDIVLNDASLAEVACELDVGESVVTLLMSGAAPREMKMFEIHRLGEVAIAVGPADGAWEELKEAEKLEEKSAAEPEAAAEPEQPTESAGAEESAYADAEAAEPEKKKSGLLVWVALLVVLLAFGICGFLAWQLGYVDPLVEKFRSFSGEKSEVEKASSADGGRLSFAEVVKAHGIEIVESEDGKTIRGNLKRRTERLAISALARAENKFFKFDLTDDETLKNCAEALLYVATESCVKPEIATNRVLELVGYIPNAEVKATIEKAIFDDVPGVKTIIWDRVEVGGTAPVQVAETKFAQTGEVTAAPAAVEEKQVSEPVVTEKTEIVAEAQPKESGKLRFELPFAGVIVKPYPCVVLADGLKLVEGATLGDAVVVSITEEKVTLKENEQLVERWL